MFIEEEDWSDEADAQVLSKTVLNNTQKANSSTNVKSKGVGKKSLLRTLQTLGSVPDWKSDAPQPDSDSETDAVPSPTKRKKKRSKRRKQVAKSGEDAENGDLDLGVKEEKTVTKTKKKDNKSGAPKGKNTNSARMEDKEITKSDNLEGNKADNAEKLSRKQWKTKMKNKRKCQNKYRPNKPEEEVNKADSTGQHSAKEQLKIDSYSNDINIEKTFTQTPALKKKKEKERKPQKRKMVIDVSSTLDTQTLKEDKESIKIENKTMGSNHVKKGAFESSGDGSKQEAGEPHGAIPGEQQHPGPSKRLKLEASKEQSRKRDQLRKLLHSQEPDKPENPTEDKVTPAEEKVKDAPADRSASLRFRMEQRLEAARFRYINEVLYTTSSGEAKRMFRQDPQAFGVYHRGYTAQVHRWPSNPVDAIISYIQQKPASLVVADFGCGDCKIARSVKNKVHSFDLAPACDLVTVCDMANVPLADGTVDIAVFCLSLMGTNLADFLVEASRVLVMGGVLKVAEVASRFENVRNFLSALASLGFKMVSKDTENSHFYSFEFEKTGNAPENVKKSGLQLKPCVYKKR
ncbi:uncharacterized protein rrp8 [Centroberyx gerrardi]